MDLAKLDVVQHPHPALRWVAKSIPVVNQLVKDLASRMIELMHDYKGIGLAATQVAVPWRMFVTFFNEKEMVFINPEVHLGRNLKDNNPRLAFDKEACLSLPGLQIEEPVPRARDVYVSALDIDGKSFVFSGAGMASRVIQHENDHLNGIMFIDRLKLNGMIQMGEHLVSMKDRVAGWLNYLATGYEYISSPKSGCPQYGTNEEEVEKLKALEALLPQLS